MMFFTIFFLEKRKKINLNKKKYFDESFLLYIIQYKNKMKTCEKN